MEEIAMGNIRVRKETGNLFFDFRYRNKRCREQTALPDTPKNRKKLELILEKIEAEITLGCFDYAAYFPGSPIAELCNKPNQEQSSVSATPLFEEFALTWLGEMKIQWRKSHYHTVKNTLDCHLIPAFGKVEVSKITKADILSFRSSLADPEKRKRIKPLSNSRINHIMTAVRMIMNEAADRFGFTTPYRGIKSLRIPRSNVEPFTMDEVKMIIDNVRKDFKNYYTVRFFTGMRTGEIDGLKWKYVDFDKLLILVRETIINGETEYTKNDGSQRDIQITRIVLDALKNQYKVTGESEYVFSTRNGCPLNHNNVTKRVWYPLLRHLGLRKRRPYQTRHTTATLWLASGENPEWIARQMGHTTTEMLFRVYSRFVPNITRQDGSAFENLLEKNF